MLYKNVSHCEWSISVFSQLSVPDIFTWNTWSLRTLSFLIQNIWLNLGTSRKQLKGFLQLSEITENGLGNPSLYLKTYSSTSVIISSQRRKKAKQSKPPRTHNPTHAKPTPSPQSPSTESIIPGKQNISLEFSDLLACSNFKEKNDLKSVGRGKTC